MKSERCMIQKMNGMYLPKGSFEIIKKKLAILVDNFHLEFKGTEPRYIRCHFKTNSSFRIREIRKAKPPIIKHPLIVVEFLGEQEDTEKIKYLLETQLKLELDPYKN